MSFLLDPPLLFATGIAIERVGDDPAIADRLSGATLATFLGVSVPLWLDAPARPLRLIWKPFGSDGPRDFMVNSGVLRLPVPRPARGRHHLAAAALFATYPLALRLGRSAGRRLASRRTGRRLAGETDAAAVAAFGAAPTVGR